MPRTKAPRAATSAAQSGAVPLPGFHLPPKLSSPSPLVPGGSANAWPASPGPPRPRPPPRNGGRPCKDEFGNELFWDGRYDEEGELFEGEEDSALRRAQAQRAALIAAPDFVAVHVPYSDPTAKRTTSNNGFSKRPGLWRGPLYQEEK
jgi:hypothetical protein